MSRKRKKNLDRCNYWLFPPVQAPFVVVTSPLDFMEWARHHCKGGRSRSERFMDRRTWREIFRNNPELSHPNAEVRNYSGPTVLGTHNHAAVRTPIYPGRATNASLLRASRVANVCLNCGLSLAGKRLDARYCSDKCKKQLQRAASVPANRTRSRYIGEAE
jgi:hypothetical protein